MPFVRNHVQDQYGGQDTIFTEGVEQRTLSDQLFLLCRIYNVPHKRLICSLETKKIVRGVVIIEKLATEWSLKNFLLNEIGMASTPARIPFGDLSRSACSSHESLMTRVVSTPCLFQFKVKTKTRKESRRPRHLTKQTNTWLMEKYSFDLDN